MRDFECVALIGEQNERQMYILLAYYDVKPKSWGVPKIADNNHGFSANYYPPID